MSAADLKVSRTVRLEDPNGRVVKVWEEPGLGVRLEAFVPELGWEGVGRLRRQLPILTVKAPDLRTAINLAEATLLVVAGRWP